MEAAFALPTGLIVVALALAGLLGAIVPTCLYLYVEPRGRRGWAVAGDTPSTRRAPLLVRLTAWMSFAVGQVALPWLLVPAACVALVLLQLKLGVARPIGLGVTGALGAVALLQAILAVRLFPLGVRLLARDPRVCEAAAATARWSVIVQGAILVGVFGLGWAMQTVPSLVHPVLRATLVWTIVRPIVAYAALGLLHALMLDRSARSFRP